jgi:hypothetical protein
MAGTSPSRTSESARRALRAAERDVAGGDEPDRAAVGRAVHDRNRRLRLALERLEHAGEAARVRLVLLRRRRAGRAHLADIGACAEDAPRPGQKYGAHGGVSGERRQRLGELRDERARQRVLSLRAVECDRDDAARVAVEFQHGHIRKMP